MTHRGPFQSLLFCDSVKPLPSVLSFIPAHGVGIVASGDDAGNDRWNLVQLNFNQQLL